MTVKETYDPATRTEAVFTGLVHGLSWITDININRMLYHHYRHWFCIYDDLAEMKLEMQEYIDELSDYWNKRMETYKLEFNPLWNVDATIETCRAGQSQEHETAAAGDESHGSQSEYGYNEVNPTATGQTDAKSNSNTDRDRQGHSREREKVVRQGNIGVTSSVQLLTEYQDEWLQSIVGEYIDSFGKFFMLI